MSLGGFGQVLGSLFAPRRSRLRQRLLALFRAKPGHEYTPQQISLIVDPPSHELLAATLDELTREGAVVRVFRVESPRSHSGIKDFQSLTEIPEVLHDWTVDEDIEVQPSLIRPIFKTHHA